MPARVIPSYDEIRCGTTGPWPGRRQTPANGVLVNNMTSQSGPNQGDTLQPHGLPPGEEPNPERREPEPSKQPGRPTPSGVPNEGLEANTRRLEGVYEYLGEGIYEYKPAFRMVSRTQMCR